MLPSHARPPRPTSQVVTRSIAHAGPDLLHFGLVFSLVFLGYAMMAHLIFGASIQRLSTFGLSVRGKGKQGRAGQGGVVALLLPLVSSPTPRYSS